MQFAYRSHQKALKAQAEGKFDDEIVPVEVEITTLNGGEAARLEVDVHKGRRSARGYVGRSAGKLKPVFHAQGTVTAGNSSQTSDGAAAAIVMSEESARKLGLEAEGAVRQLRRRRRAAGDHGHRAGGRDSEGAGAGRVEARRHRRDRIERSVRGAGAGGDSRGRTRSGHGESERRRDRAGASAGLHRRETDGDDSARDGAPRDRSTAW